MSNLSTSRRAFRRTDDFTPGTPKVKLVTEPLPPSIPATSVLIKVHAIALNYRDANIANGGNPWPVTPNGILANDAAGEIIALGNQVKYRNPNPITILPHPTSPKESIGNWASTNDIQTPDISP